MKKKAQKKIFPKKLDWDSVRKSGYKTNPFFYGSVAALVFLVTILIISSFLPKSSEKNNGQLSYTSGGKEIRSGEQKASIEIRNPSGVLSSNGQTGETASMTTDTHDDHMNMTNYQGVIPAGTRVKYKISTFQKLATQPLKFNVYDAAGKELTPELLSTVHEHKMHFIVVSADLKEFLHLHPEYRNGVWNVSAYLPTPGTYYTYVDIDPIEGDPVVLQADLTVRKATDLATVTYPPVQDMVAKNNGYKASLSINNLIAQESTRFMFELFQTDGKPAQVEPYLEAYGHVVLFKQGNPLSFTHVHPLDSGVVTQGKVDFESVFREGGVYTAFAEFKLKGKVYVFPFTFAVK